MRFVVSGASGLIGTALDKYLSGQGHEVVKLVRGKNWNTDDKTIDQSVIDTCDVVVNLAGAGVGDKRWTPQRKALLVSSRTGSTDVIVDSINRSKSPPKALINASAIGVYPDSGTVPLAETAGAGDSFLASLVEKWEQSANRATCRVVTIRTGIVLSSRGGALAKQVPVFKAFLGGYFGSGTQYNSWIDVDDEVRAIEYLAQSDLEGPVNLCAPNPVTARQFAKSLGEVLGRPSFLPIPSFAVSMIFGPELVKELFVLGKNVFPKQLIDAGFKFLYEELDESLRNQLAVPSRDDPK